MRDTSHHKTKHIILLRVLVIALIVVTWYAVDVLNKAGQLYSDVAASTASQPTIAASHDLNGTEIDIPTYDMFKPGNLWTLVSKERPLSGEAGYTLVDIPVAHGDEGVPMKVAVDIADELEQLVNAAEADEEPLMVSSAYRSLKDQKELYDEFVEENGTALAAQYVLPVGASEHHTGLTVDFSSVSDDCAEDSDTCSLSQSAAQWLAQNAPRFGFILRYPDGAQSTTGVRYEPWHYRFVGRPLAKVMSQTDLTFEEVVEQLAPGYARPRS